VRTWRCTWRPLSCELRDALGVRDRSRLEYLDVVDLQAVDWEGGATGAETGFNG